MARRSEPLDIILLVILLSMALPVSIILIEGLAGFWGKRVRMVVHGLAIAVLTAATALPILSKAGGVPGGALLLAAVVLGVAGVMSYMAYRPVQMFVTALSPAILVFPGAFLLHPQISKVVFPKDDPLPVAARMDAHVPIVIVIFDELPLYSLLDENREIDSIRYPNFAALAQDSYWFRNATTVAQSTNHALPAILTGKYPEFGKLPIAADHPHNLFTLLANSYELNVVEPVTYLCPRVVRESRLSSAPRPRSLTVRMASLLSDLSVVCVHILLPSDLAAGVPGISDTWLDFTMKTRVSPEHAGGIKETADSVSSLKRWLEGSEWQEHAREVFQGDRGEQFRRFLSSIHVSKRPSLNLIHALLPHTPYNYLPSGKRYYGGLDLEGFSLGMWSGDEWALVQAFQRHLLQVGAVDQLMGELLARLKQTGLYQRSLIVVTSDHGSSFRVNDSRRAITETNYPDILPVPLFVKAPHQRTGSINDRNVELIDILPTICHLLGIQLPWRVDGHSALDVSLPERKHKYAFVGKKELRVFESTIVSKETALQRKLSLFGSGVKTGGLYKVGPHASLVGKHLSAVDMAWISGVTVELERKQFFNAVRRGSGFLPSRIIGRILGFHRTEPPLTLAIAVNDTVYAVTRIIYQGADVGKFSAMVPENVFRDGKNTVEVLGVSGVGDHLVLYRFKEDSEATYSLSVKNEEGEEFISSSHGISMPVLNNVLRGRLDEFLIIGDYVVFAGWAADVNHSRAAEEILIFVNGEFFYSGRTPLEREGIARLYGIQTTGFQYEFPLAAFGKTENLEVRFFVVSRDGFASELEYHQGYKWRKNVQPSNSFYLF